MVKENPHFAFRIAVAVSVFLMLSLAVFLLMYGKKESFIIINGNYNPELDLFFQYVTVLGDGIIYIPLVIYSLIWNRKYLLAIMAAVIICTILTHLLKRIIFPHELRPVSLEIENIIIHKVENVPVHRLHSFPSGHTSTAFTMALLLAAIMENKFWAVLLPIIAFLVGYSRVYLAQHFVSDVCAGISIGIVSAYFSLLIYDWYWKKKTRKTTTTAASV